MKLDFGTHIDGMLKNNKAHLFFFFVSLNVNVALKTLTHVCFGRVHC